MLVIVGSGNGLWAAGAKAEMGKEPSLTHKTPPSAQHRWAGAAPQGMLQTQDEPWPGQPGSDLCSGQLERHSSHQPAPGATLVGQPGKDGQGHVLKRHPTASDSPGEEESASGVWAACWGSCASPEQFFQSHIITCTAT